jgi:TRAP-type C4-dicarboxylate transport system permease large subunit
MKDMPGELYVAIGMGGLILAYGVWIIWYFIATRKREPVTLVTLRRDARRTRVGLLLALLMNASVIAQALYIGTYGLINLVSFACIGAVTYSLRLNWRTLRDLDDMEKKAPGDR